MKKCVVIGCNNEGKNKWKSQDGGIYNVCDRHKHRWGKEIGRYRNIWYKRLYRWLKQTILRRC